MATSERGTTIGPNREEISGIFLFFGISLVILGMIAVAAATVFTITSTIIFGGLLMAAGIAEMINAFGSRPRVTVWLSLLSGILYLIVGGFIMFNPLVGAVTLTLALAVFLLTAGIIRSITAFRPEHQDDRGWFLFGGVLDIILGLFVLSQWPQVSAWLIGLLVGLEMIVHGIAWLAGSATLEKRGTASEVPLDQSEDQQKAA